VIKLVRAWQLNSNRFGPLWLEKNEHLSYRSFCQASLDGESQFAPMPPVGLAVVDASASRF
jgi:hypothetical protein